MKMLLFLTAGMFCIAGSFFNMFAYSMADSCGCVMMMMSGFIATMLSMLTCWWLSMPASVAAFVPPAAMMMPFSVESVPATHMES